MGSASDQISVDLLCRQHAASLYMVVSFSFRFVCLFFCPKNVRPFLSKIGGWDLVCGLFSQIQAQLRCYGRWKTTFGGESTPKQVRLRFGMLTVLTNIRSTKVLW